MAREIELKLHIGPADASRLAAHPRLAGVQPTRQRLVSTYYDTPERALQQHAIALRFRRIGRRWVLTVKGGDPSRGGLAARAEWETARRPGDFDFSHVDDDGLRAFLDEMRPGLLPVFTSDFTRLAWQVEQSGSAIEVALDRGHLIAGDARTPISEMEMELVGDGAPAALFELAIALAEDISLYPAAASKAERGYALFDHIPAAPARAEVTAISRKTPLILAYRQLSLDCLDHLQKNHEGMVAGEDPEFIHQSRIAIRRLRSLLGLFSPVLPAEFTTTFAPPWREVARVMGLTRDWDVLLTETLARLPPGALPASRKRRLESAATKARDTARQEAMREIAQPGYGQFLLRFTHALLELSESPTHRPSEKLPRFVQHRIDGQLRKIRRLLKRDGLDNEVSRHAVRIALKKLRYAVEFFAPLVDSKRRKALVRQAATAQQVLGHLNDIATARRLFSTLANHAAGTDAWLEGEEALALGQLRKAIKPFRRKM